MKPLDAGRSDDGEPVVERREHLDLVGDQWLVLPYAALGLAGGWLTGLSLDSTHSTPLTLMLSICTPISCALLGGFLQKRIDPHWFTATWFATILAGGSTAR